MKQNLAEVLVDWSGQQLEIRKDYSGRGMYGETTCGVVGDSSDFYEAVGEVIREGEYEEREELAEFISNMKQDSMGMQTIFY